MILLEEVLYLHPRQIEILKKILPVLAKLGFEIEPFGEKTFVVRSLPAMNWMSFANPMPGFTRQSSIFEATC